MYYALPLRLQITARKIFHHLRLTGIISREQVVVATFDGLTYKLDLSEMIDSVIYYQGYWELDTTKIIKRIVSEGMTVFDIGANMGVITLLLARQVGKTGTVVAFEPTSSAFERLQHNVELNSFVNVHLENKALSDGVQTETAHIKSSYKLTQSKYHPLLEDNIEFTTLDEYVQMNHIADVGFIKIDTDGYEYNVVIGSRKTIERFKPILIIEFSKYNLKKYGYNVKDLAHLLSKMEYSFYSEKDLSPYDSIEALVRSIPDHSSATLNVVCMTKEARNRFNI